MTPFNFNAAALRNGSSLTLGTLALALFATTTAFASPGLVDNSASPNAKVQSVGLSEGRWTDGFWADRFGSFRTRLLPAMNRLREGNHYSQYFHNFKIAAGLAEGNYRGAPFNDGDFYKLLEAEIAAYAVTHEPALDQHLDRVIAVKGTTCGRLHSHAGLDWRTQRRPQGRTVPRPQQF